MAQIPISKLLTLSIDELSIEQLKNAKFLISYPSDPSKKNASEYVTRSVKGNDLSSLIDIAAATQTKIGGIRIGDNSLDGLDNKHYVQLDNEDKAYIEYPPPDDTTITNNTGKLKVNTDYIATTDDIDKCVKKASVNIEYPAEDNKYIAGIKQVNGKIASIEKRDLPDYQNLSVEDYINSDPKSNNTNKIPSTYLAWTFAKNTYDKLPKSSKTGDITDMNGYLDLVRNINNLSEKTFVDLSSTQTITSTKKFENPPESNDRSLISELQPDTRMVNAYQVKQYVTNKITNNFKTVSGIYFYGSENENYHSGDFTFKQTISGKEIGYIKNVIPPDMYDPTAYYLTYITKNDCFLRFNIYSAELHNESQFLIVRIEFPDNTVVYDEVVREVKMGGTGRLKPDKDRGTTYSLPVKAGTKFTFFEPKPAKNATLDTFYANALAGDNKYVGILEWVAIYAIEFKLS